MAFTKFATFDSAEILDVRSTATKQHVASLDKFSDYNDYRTQDGYLYARIRAISSRVNKNNDGWPSIELAGSPEIFDRHQSSIGFTVEAAQGSDHGFATFVGKPIFVDHNNTNPEDTRGVIVDAKLHVEDSKTAAGLDPYYASAPDNHKPPTWVELLLEVDAKEFPKFAKALIEGSKNPKKGIDGFSMGCDVTHTICSHCDNKAESPEDFCEHIKLKGAHLKSKKTGKMERAYEDCYGIKFFEISGVFDPADETALVREVKSSLIKEAPGNQHLPGASDKRNRQYEDIKKSCLEGGKSEEECKELAARTVNKQRAEHGETKKGSFYADAYEPEWGATEDSAFAAGANDHPCRNCGHPYSKHGPPWARQHEECPTVGAAFAQGALSNVHTADNSEPQDDHLRVPDPVDTLREDKICPICGSNYDGHTCEVCGYVEPPEGLNNPDLDKAQEENPDLGSGDRQQEENVTELPESEKGVPDELNSEKPGQSYLDARNDGTTSHVTNEMAWKASKRINKGEVPILSGSPSQSNEPTEKIISDASQPQTTRTASDFVAAAGATNQETNMTDRVAAEPLPDARADKRVDVTGVGGVIEDSNESASKADAQINVEGVGGAGVTDVEADEHQSIDQTSDNAGFDQGGDKSNNSGPTKTWTGEKGQTSPITSQPFPASADGVKSSTEHVGYDDGTLEQNEQQGDEPVAQGGSATKGTQPADPVGKADQRVNLLEHTTTPENNSGPTKTWTGTDGNGVTKQQPPVTREPTQFGGINSHVVAVFKLADTEVDMGIIEKDQKWERVAQLEHQSEAEVTAQLSSLERVRTAGLKKNQPSVGGRVPSLKTASTPVEKSATVDEEFDSALFN